MRKLLFSLSFALLAASTPFSLPLQAQEVPTITITKGDTIALALTPISGADGAQISKLVEKHLNASGYFNIVPDSRASMIVSGSTSGSQLQGSVNDRSGSVVLSRSYSGSAAARANAYANDIIETLTGNRGMAGSKVAFVATRTGKKEIYLADYDGTNLKQLTHDNTISVAPALSSDGRKLAYTSYLHGYADIYLIDLVSGARNRIVKFPGTNSGAAFSPDGSRIACTVSRDGNPELYLLNTNGSGARRLTRTAGVESSPAWSPDGSELVYASDDRGGPRIFRVSASGGTPRMISTGHNYCTKPSWSADGRRIAFNVRNSSGFSIAVHDLATGSTKVLASGRDPIWGPSPRHLIYSSDGNLMLLDVQTGRQTRLISGLGQITEPAWTR